MNPSSAKDNILQRIRQALATPVPFPFPASEGSSSVFHPAQSELEVIFAENFSALQGRFSYCVDEKEMMAQLVLLMQKKNLHHVYCQEAELRQKLVAGGVSISFEQDIAAAEAGITTCEMLVARTGSIILSSGNESGRTGSVFPPVHICIAYTHQLVYDITESLQQLTQEYGENLPSFITLATGPSRTADIEKTLVVGVHGPKEVFVFLVEG